MRREDIEVRESTPDDVLHAPAASELIRIVAREYDIALREPEWLAAKMRGRRAALALAPPEAGAGAAKRLVGFGYWSAWENDRFVSHSGLVVHPDCMGLGIGRRVKTVLFESSARQLPRATMMSLTTSPQVKRMNESLGFRVVPLDRLTSDDAFWRGCETCRNYAEVRARGERCCCEGMIRPPDGWPEDPS